MFGAKIGLKALKTFYFAYFSGQWGRAVAPPATPLIRLISDRLPETSAIIQHCGPNPIITITYQLVAVSGLTKS